MPSASKVRSTKASPFQQTVLAKKVFGSPPTGLPSLRWRLFWVSSFFSHDKGMADSCLMTVYTKIFATSLM
jgi:hypothetical protein